MIEHQLGGRKQAVGTSTQSEGDNQMTSKGRKQPLRKVRNLKWKSLSADKAKQIKGGPCPGTNTSSLRFS